MVLHSTETTGNKLESEEGITESREEGKTDIANFTKD